MKDNKLVESAPIEWEKFKEAFLGMKFPWEWREEAKEFIKLSEDNKSNEEYSLKFTIFSSYVPPWFLNLGMRRLGL